MKNLIRLIAVAFIVSCSTSSTKKGYLITGEIENLGNGYIISISPVLKSENKVSVTSSKNEFIFQLDAETDEGEYTLEILNPLDSTKQNLYFWYSKQDLLFKGDFNEFKKIKVDNDKTNRVIKKYYQIVDNYDDKISKLLETIKDPNKLNVLVTKYFDSIQKNQNNLIFNESNNPFSVHKIIFLKNKFSSDSLSLFYKSLSPELKNSKDGKLLNEYLSFNQVETNKEFLDFEAKTIDGKDVKLSDFKGKIILLDFWANWCTWCHVQNKEEFTPLQNKYKDDLIIISYSLDEKLEDWQQAVKKDSYQWENLSNLKGMKDPVTYIYKINMLPHSYLIDKEGKVIKQFIGYDGKNIIESDIKKLLN